MIIQQKQIIFLFWLFCLPGYTVFSQAQTSKDNYTGAWETPSTWDPVWPVPMTDISGSIAPYITINGYITANNSLLFSGTATNLIINDTLIIKGDLSIDNNNDLTINDNGILIVWGNLNLNNQSQITANGYLIVIGNVYKGGTVFQGSWTSNDNPVKLFVGGTLPATLADNVPNYPAVNCTSPASTPYTNTGCSYGNMTDLAGDPIFVLLQNNCSVTNVKTTLQACIAGVINLTSSYGTTYSWSGPNGFTSSLQNPSIPDASPAMAGNYKIVVTNAICTDTDTINVIVNPIPGTPTITAGGPITFCEGNTVTLTSSEGSSYLWSTGATTQSINVVTTGNYTVQVTNTGGCMSLKSAITKVRVNAIPVTPTITANGPTTFCSGGNVTLTSSAEAIYLWSTGAVTQSTNITAAGNYTVQVTNASGCTSAASVATIVTVYDLPVTPSITVSGPTTFCAGGNVTLTSSAGTSYIWSTGATTSNINVTTAGSYKVQVTNANGCQSAVSAATEVYVNALPPATVGSNSPVCAGNTINLTSSGGTTYRWEGPDGYESNAQSPSIPNAGTAMTGSYTVTVTDDKSCVVTNTTSVFVNENPVANAGQDQELKFITETEMTAELSSSETGEWSLISGSGVISDIQSPITRLTELQVGENIFLWKVRNGNCEDTAEVKITVYDPFVPSVITPDGDGKNDYFRIGEIIDQVELIIFNRWGNEEYSNSNYLNDWDGRNNKGRELPNDTYFYVLKFGNLKILKGSVLIKR